MTLERRIHSTTAIVVLLALILGIVLFLNSLGVRQGLDQMSTSSKIVETAFLMRTLMDEYLVEYDSRPLAQWLKVNESLGKTIRNVQRDESIDRSLLKELEESYREVNDLHTQIIQSRVSGDQDQQQKLLGATLAGMMAVRLEELVNTAQFIRRSTQSKTLIRQNMAQLSIVGAFLIMVGLIVLNLYLMKRSILQPLRALAAAGVTSGADDVQRYDKMDVKAKTGGLTETFQMLVERIQAVQESLRMETTERAHAQEALQRLNEELEMRVLDRTAELTKANQKLQALMDALPVGVSFLDESCQRITGNSYFFAQFELTPDDNISGFATTTTLSRFARFLRNGRDVGDTELPLQRAVAEKRVIPPIELDVHLPSGRRWIAEASGAPILDEQGDVLGGVAVTVDISERRSAERALKESEERLRLAQSSANIGIWEWHVPSGKVFWTEELEKIYGYREGTFPGTYEGFSERVHPDDLGELERLYKEALKASQPFDADFRILLPSGEMRWVNCKGAAQYDEKGYAERIFGVNVDITERKKAREELEWAHNTLAEAQKIAHMGSFEYVAATQTTVWSEEEYRIYGLDPAWPSPTYDLMLQNCIHPDDAALLHETFTQAMQSRSVYELEHRIVLPDGSVRWVHDRAHPHFDEQGELTRYVGTTLDITERKMVEEALQQSEEKFRSIFENSPLGVVHCDAKGIVTACNDSFVRIVGTPLEKMIGLNSIRDLNDENLMAAVREALAGGKGHYEGQYTSLITNKTIHIKADIAPMFNRDGAVVGAIGIYEDIAARMQMERQLKESEEKYRRLHETMRDAFVSVDMTGRILETNQAYQEMLGYSAEELRSLTYMDLTPQKWHAIEAVIVRDEIVQKGFSGVYEKEYRKKDGTIFPVELRTFLMRDENGVPLSMWGIARDITERKRTEAEIRALNQDLEAKVHERTAELEKANSTLREEIVARTRAEESVAANLEATSRLQRIGALYIGESDLQQVLEEIVEAAIALTGADKGNIQIIDPQSNCLKIVAHRGFDQPFLDFWNRVYEGQGSCGNAFEAGQRVIVEDITKSPIFVDTPALQLQLAAGVRAVQSTPLIGRSGKLLGMISTHFNSPHWPDERTLTLLDILVRQTTDIIERAEYEAELKEAVRNLTRSNQDLEHFAYVASHDLQEPLRTITSSLQMFEKRNKGQFDKNSDQLIDYAVDGAKRMKALVQDLLAYSRVTSQGQSFKAVDMNEILDQSIVNCGSLIKAKGTSITYDEMPTVIGDPTQLTQLLQNLIGNAVKFGPAQSSKVHVSAQLNGDEWLFSVKDNGIGIDKEYFQKIFVIFQQLSKKGPFHGTGIGLAVVKKIVERHRGRVWVESKAGVGSTFYFTIPNRSES